MKYRHIFLLVAGLCLLFLSARAEADIRPGVRMGAYSSPGSVAIGGELLANINRDWYFNPNAEFVFRPKADLWTVNFDVHYDLPTRAPVYFWVGAGPAVLHRDPDGRGLRTTTDLGANMFVGVGFNKGGRVTPYIQPKVVIANKSLFALTFGARF